MPSRPQLDPGSLIPVAVCLLLLRAPGGVLLMGVVGVTVLLWRGVRVRPSNGLLVAYAVCTATSATAAVLARDGNPTSYVWSPVCFGLFSAAVLWTGDVGANVRGVAAGLLAGFTTALGLAWFEIVTGLRLLTIGREDNKGLQQSLSDGRFRTGAFYTNYNDLSVALTILSILLVGAILFLPRVTRNVQVLRLVSLVAAASLVVLMGSRGSLAALLLGVAVLVLLAARAVRPHVWTHRRVGLTALAAAALGYLAWNSPYVQDHSTAARERIAEGALRLMDLDPITWVIGYSSDRRYLDLATALYHDQLMNPHNLVLELLLAYGLPGLVAVGVVWVVLVTRGLSVIRPKDWTVSAFTAAVLVLPVLGTVPSSTLPYGFPQLLALGLAGALATAGPSRRAASTARL